MDDALGHWIAGFVDGEGCFLICKNSYTYDCRFNLVVRDDDKGALEIIQAAWDVGRITPRTVYTAGTKPQAALYVRKQECMTLCDFFDRYPLRAKKARDFAIWKQAVCYWVTREPRTGWEEMKGYHEALKSARSYK